MAESQEPLTDRELSAMKSFMENRAFEYRAFAEAPKIIDGWVKARAEFRALPKQREAIVKEIADLETRKVDAEARTHGAVSDANKAEAEAKAKKEALAKQLSALEREVIAKQQKIAGLDGEYAERLKAKDLEIQSAQARVDKLNAEAERVRQHFAAA